MSKSVAVDGEVTASADSGKIEADSDQTGSWSAGSVSYQTYSHFKIDGTAVIYEASCTFTYAGGQASGSSIGAVTDTVTLSASGTKTQGGLNAVLRDGDSEESASGNKLEVSTNRSLKSA
jgi:hypothetical protein